MTYSLNDRVIYKGEIYEVSGVTFDGTMVELENDTEEDPVKRNFWVNSEEINFPNKDVDYEEKDKIITFNLNKE